MRENIRKLALQIEEDNFDDELEMVCNSEYFGHCEEFCEFFLLRC